MLSVGGEHRAKRTHARRSCELCKVRKTRCELPDLDVPSSSNALPDSQSCHRCRVLILPCVVDDSSRKIRKRPKDDEIQAGPSRLSYDSPGQPSPKRRSSKPAKPRSMALDLLDTDTLGVNHFLDIIHGFVPDDPTAPAYPSVQQQTPIDPQLVSSGGDTAESPRMMAMKLHGRPMELVCAMFRAAHGKDASFKRKVWLDVEDLNLEDVVDSRMRSRLEIGVAQLRVFHPHLDPLPELFATLARTPSSSISLLLALVVYLASLALPVDPIVDRLRKDLAPYILSLRDTTMLHLPQSFHALQALEMLSMHAPLGILPLQTGNPRTLAVARGQLSTALQIGQLLAFPAFIRTMIRATAGSQLCWQTTESWSWLSLCAAEAMLVLEDETPKKPVTLAEAHSLAETFLSLDHDTWREEAVKNPASAVGKLALCDRIERLVGVFDSLARLRNVLELSAQDPAHDTVGAVVAEMKQFTMTAETLDSRHDTLLDLLSINSGGIESGWKAYRSVRRRFESNKVYLTGLRYLMATSYLPGSRYAFSDLPIGMLPAQAVLYAISRATSPSNITAFMQGNTDAVQAVVEWGAHRGEIAEQLLSAIAEISQKSISIVSDPNHAEIVPLHDVFCIAVEGAKTLMEMQAGSIVMGRTSQNFPSRIRFPTWSATLRHVCQNIRAVGTLLPDDQRHEGESIENGCSNLIGSMLRLADEWLKTVEKDEDDEQVPAESTPMEESSYLPPPAPPKPLYAPPPHQSYMPTSDRWMAADHDQGGYQPQVNGNGGYPPTALDTLLSEMFQYSYNVPTGQGAVEASAVEGHEVQEGWEGVMEHPMVQGNGHTT